MNSTDVVEGEITTNTPCTPQAIPAAGTSVIVNLAYSGVALDGTDFSGVASVTIPAGSSSNTFTIPTIDDALAEGAESFTVEIDTSRMPTSKPLQKILCQQRCYNHH